MKTFYEAYSDKAIILVIYMREAHPAGRDETAEKAGWKAIDGTVFFQPTTYEERRRLAETACTFWELPIPALVDTMETSIGGTYQAFPNRLYLIDTAGKIVYRGAKGPRGVNVYDGEVELRKLLGITEGKLVTEPSKQRSAPSGRGRLGSRTQTPEPKDETSDEERQTPWWLLGDSDKESNSPKPKESESGDKPQKP